MGVVDRRRSLIVSTAGHFFGLSVHDEEAIEGSEQLDTFLDQTTCRTLCAQPTDMQNDGAPLRLSNELPLGKNTLVFFKLAAHTVTIENFRDLVQVVSTGGGKGSTLIEALRQVWAPALRSSGLNPSILKKLEEDLLGPQSSTTILEEEGYWRKKRDEAKRSHEKALCEDALNLLKNIRAEVESAAVSRDGLLALEESLDIVSGHMDDLWKLGNSTYNEERMKILLDVVGNEVASLVENFIDEISTSDVRAKDEAILTGAKVCEKWVNLTERMTRLFWPHHSLHTWKDPVFIPLRCSKLGRRLRQIAELRAQHRQLTRLLTPSERSALETDSLLQCFNDVKALLTDDDNDIKWDRMVRKIEEGLSPAEERVAQKLKVQISGADTPHALLTEFRRYAELLKRASLKRSLRSERESLLSAYGDLIESCLAGPDTESLLDCPKVLQEIQAARYSELRLESLSKLGKELLSDLPGYNEMSSKVNTALKDAEKKRQYLVDNWVEDTKGAIQRKELTLGTDTAVVELTGTSMMRVTYDPRLTTLIREARALSGQGVELPREVRDLVERASALAGRARALQQVATFHNTIGDRMVPSQRPLMLTTALELARAVQEQSGVVWSDPHAVDTYTARLRELVRKFARQNSELAAKHASLRDHVSNLLTGNAVNLVGNQNVWKETLMNMRTIVDGVEAEYGNTKAWKLHWDRQLLKALGVAYRGAIPSMLKKLPDIRVELTFRDGSLQWRPSLEEVRAKIYSGIRRSLSIPINFRGVGDAADARFADLVPKSAYLFGGVYKQAELALSAMESLRVKWIYLAAPAKIHAGDRLKGKSPHEWTRAFKDAKQWAQEVGKLHGNDVKIWCITADMGTIRSDLESASRRCWEHLCADLRVEASSRLVAIVEFLSAASKDLERRPRNIEEVGQAYEAHERIEKQSAGMAAEMEAVTGLAKVLAAWTSEQLDGVSAVHTSWQDLAERVERHKAIVARQLEDTKVNLRHRAVAWRDEKERWEAKWASRENEITLDWVSLMRERWINISEQRDSLKTDCQVIGVNLDEILEDSENSLARLELELEAEESNCRFQAEFLEELKNQESEEWAVARRRLPRLHDWLDSWEARIRAQSKHETADGSAAPEIDTFVGRKVKSIRSAIEWIQILRGDEVAEEHWTELKPILGLDNLANTKELTLGHLFESIDRLKENIDKVKEITKRAAAESGIRQALVELESWESSASLQLQDSKDSKNMPVRLVGEYGTILARAGELRLLLEGAKNAPGYERFAARASRCEAGLSELEERIKVLSTVQRKWVYLEPVYGGGAAPNDSGRWSRADKEFRYLMGEVSRDPRVPSLRRLPLPALSNLKDLLERCQKSLDEFLEDKRSSYPRLYFLSDEDLLELVSGGGRGLDTHLPKLYQGVGSVVKNDNTLTAVISPEGEVLKLPGPVDLNEPLPRWLGELEAGMKNALRQSLETCLTTSIPDPSIYPTQVLLLSERIRFTERCENAVKEGRSALKNLVEFLETQRARYRGLEDAGDKLTALKARGLLLDTVHHLEVARTVLSSVLSGASPTWLWHRQLRSYKSNNGPVIRCAGAEFPYGFEYQGASVGLVRTPLTERCFLALTQAMMLGLGGSPTGPAGTGKTESVKALGAILGRLVLVFNCDEGMDARSMRRILGGLAQAGAWGCFDEFNRLEEETLSAVAMLVRPLQESIRDGASQVLLADQTISLNRHCCVFITMNPAGSEYGGRHKLPDSLARLFRPIGMAHPDRSDIVKALLECGGFLEASTLANQLVETLDIAEILLSKQPHYDWGLRALRSVLDAVTPSEEVNETTRLVKAIKTSMLPKLTEDDTPKFLALLNDIFPNVDETQHASTEDQDLQRALVDLSESQGLTEEVINRCIQLKDQLRSRTGVVIVGPPGSGKTTIRKLLAEAMARIGETVNQFLIYPGAMPKSRLLGRVNSRTREWKDGLLSSIVATAGESLTWIIFNGDVEPEWAEALNSALDDNRLLTLPNGVGIKLGNGTRFIFETHKLSEASPATVSRLGVIHLASLNLSALLSSSGLGGLSLMIRNIVNTYLPTFVEQTLKYNETQSSAFGLIQFALCHLRSVSSQMSAMRAFLLSLCGQIENAGFRDELARLIYQTMDCWCPDPQKPYDVLFNKETDRLEPFTAPADSIDTDAGPASLSGPVKRALATVQPWIEMGYPTLIRAPEGCGKSTLISVALTMMKNNSNETSTLIKGSSVYGPQDLITRLKRLCVRLDSSSHGRSYKPKIGSKIILLLEDLHLASKDLQELVRELLQEKGFHEEDLEFAKIPLTVICTADASTRLHPRLEPLFATHNLPYPRMEDIQAALELHLKDSLLGNQVMAESWITRQAPAMLEAFRSIGEQISQDASFTWSPKELVSWARTLKHYGTPENEAEATCNLMDAGRRLFYPRLSPKECARWESILSSKIQETKDHRIDVYVWKHGSTFLLPLGQDQWEKEIDTAAAKCAREGDPVKLPISSHILETAAGISWALGTKMRGIVLAGRPGAGRKTATKLTATFSNLRLIDSGPGRGKASVKAAVQAAGIDGEPTLLLLEEHHTREEELAILASAIVSRGEVPGLFTMEELDGLVAPLADLARVDDFSGTLEQYLYHRLRNNLRVVIILDNSEANSTWLRRTGLLKDSTLIGPGPKSEWWSRKTHLTQVATQHCSPDEEQPTEPSEAIGAMVKAHLHAPKEQQAPARFLALMNTWKHLREIWSKDVESKLTSLEAGISRLREAGDQVAKLEDEVSKQRQELEAEKSRANAALEQITATMRGATGQRGEMTNLKAETERESAELARRKVDIEGELGKVEPLVEQAAQAVAGISADALAEVRSLRAPPAPVRDVLEGVLRLMGIKDTSWNSMKTFLAKRGIKDEIRTWDARRSTAASLEAVAKLVKERPESFEEKTAKRASIAAAPLAAWVLANLQYGQILQQVAPLEQEQRQLADRLSAAEAQLGRLAAGLSTVESRVAQLQEELAEHSRGAAALQLRAEATEAKLTVARSLLQKLDTEHRDWQTQLEELTTRKQRLDIEAATVASLLVYQDSEDDDKQKKSAIELLISERERLQWRAQGLPADTESFIGAACALKGPLVSIFVDPSGVAVSWLKSNIGSTLAMTKPEDSKFLTTLELAVRFGRPLLVEEIVRFPPVLLPLLRRRVIRIGDRTLPAQPTFKLFLATRSDKLDDLPKEADAVLFKVALGAGVKSLAERFIEKVLLKETPGLETQRREALEREEKLSGERDAARLDLLAQLGTARGQDLLQESQSGHGSLLSSLEATQSKAKEIALALDESRKSLEEVAGRAKAHENVAKFAANLYNTIRALTALSPLYVFSAEAFTNIYLEAENRKTSASSAEKERIIEKKLVALALHLCAKGAYRKHRLSLALHLALSLNPVSEPEKNFLLDKTTLNDENSEVVIPDWIPEERAAAVRRLGSSLPQVIGKLKANWLEDVGLIYAENNLSFFQRILIIKALRPDHLHTALSKYAAEQLGVRDLAPPPWSLRKIAEDKESDPVLLLLSPGADPSPELSALANNNVASAAGFTEISLGQGQVAQAELALESACRSGSWILLSNLQLALNWLPRLESLLRSPMCTSDKNPSTRIWLTTEECIGFYPGLAGLCTKLAYEPPEGVKRNVKRSLQQLQQLKQTQTRSVSSEAFLLAWLHAVLQERRRFVPQGWTRAHEWSEADLEAASALVVKEMSGKAGNDQEGVWEATRGLLDVAVYGGRLQDDYDMRALCAIIRNVWSREVYEGRRKLGGVLRLSDALEFDPIRAIERLEDEDSPRDYFGLPTNAHRAWERAAAERALAHLKRIAADSTKRQEKAETSEESKTQRSLIELFDRRGSSTASFSLHPPKETSKNPLQQFFADEIEHTKKLLNLVRSEAYTLHFDDSKTPRHWMREWQTGPKEVLPFVRELLFRHEALESFDSSVTQRVDLSRLARPRAFLAALKQHTSRESKKPLENLRLRAHWIENNANSDWKTSVVIEGLLVSGAVIKNGALNDLKSNASAVAAAPCCQIAFLSDDDAGKQSGGKTRALHVGDQVEEDILHIPVYANSQRDALICSFPVGCPREDRDVWLQRGVALHLKSGQF